MCFSLRVMLEKKYRGIVIAVERGIVRKARAHARRERAHL